MTDIEPDLRRKRKWRADVVRLSISILESERDYRNLGVLGRGTYGDVFRMYDPLRDNDIAIKVVTSDNISEIELAVWPHLHHPNIIPLLDLLTLDPLEAAMFIMPVQEKSLHDVLQDKYFRKREGNLMYVKAWLYEILCGLEYLHSRNLCHLDIKVDNILLSHQYTAMLCDFSFLNFTTKSLERYDLGLPYIYRPPEVCHSLGEDIKIDGVSYDMWGFGVMVVEIFTQFVLANTVSNEKCWYIEVYPTLFQALQENQFKNAMIETFPLENMNSVEISLALNFIHLFLNSDYKKRWTSTKAKRHAFLGAKKDLGPVADPIWISRGAIKRALKTIELQDFVNNELNYESDLSDSDELEEDTVRLKNVEEEKYLSQSSNKELLRGRQTPGTKHLKHTHKDRKFLKSSSLDLRNKSWSDNSSEERVRREKLVRKKMAKDSKSPENNFTNQCIPFCSSENPDSQLETSGLAESIFKSHIESSSDQGPPTTTNGSSVKETELNIAPESSAIGHDISLVEKQDLKQKNEQDSNIENTVIACEPDIQTIYYDEQLPQGSGEVSQIGSFLAPGDNTIYDLAVTKKLSPPLFKTSPYSEQSDESTQCSTKSCREICEEIKKLQMHINHIDKKITELTSVMSCENHSTYQVFENSTSARPKVKHPIEHRIDKISESNLVVETSASETLTNIQEVERALAVDETSKQKREHHEDKLDSFSNISSTVFKFEFPLSKSKGRDLGIRFESNPQNEKKREKGNVLKYRKMLKWFRKRYSSLEKMLKTIPFRIMK